MQARIEIHGSDVLCSSAISEIRLPLADHRDRMHDWARRYDRAVRSQAPDLLTAIGTEMFQWLNQQAWISRWIEQPGARVLEIAVQGSPADADALLDVPWEILRDARDFLAADGMQLFQVFRRIGTAHATPPAPAYSDLTVMFMAAAPNGQKELDYEAEEIGILDATKGLPLRLSVEESGNLEFLGRRLSQDGPFDVLHLSCHGDIAPGKGPVLLLESPGGEAAAATADDIVKAVRSHPLALIFVSACRTAEMADPSSEPLVRALVRSGIPNMLGWDGSVRDSDASRFACVLYDALARHYTVPQAAAQARHDLLADHRHDPTTGSHWHLARVYCGPGGGGALNEQRQPSRDKPPSAHGAFLGAEERVVPVAPANKFVGRRREAQRIIRTLRHSESLGVLIQGMGNLGKSSLAARVADRMPHLRPVVVFGRYDALSILEKLAAAVPDSAARLTWSNTWKELVAQTPDRLAEATEDLLTKHLRKSPILLIVDDLERILEAPAPDQSVQPVKTADQPVLAALFKGFKAAASSSRLLLTSRYPFTLSDGKGHDWARDLVVVPLHAMEDRQRRKQWRAATTAAAATPPRTEEERQLVAAAIQAAGGNPGLQDVLCRPVLNGEVAVARRAIDAVQAFRDTGNIQVNEATARKFLEHVFAAYAQALQDSERRQMRAATLFDEGIPVPVAALKEVGKAFAITAPDRAIDRLLALGLMDDWGMIDGIPHAALNPLARGLAQPPLSDEEQSALATAALPILAELWRDKDGNIHTDDRGVEAMRLALLGEASPEVLDATAIAGGGVLFHRDHDAKTAFPRLRDCLNRLEQNGAVPSLPLLFIAANCAERLGERAAQITWLRQGAERQTGDKLQHAQITVRYAEATLADKGPEQTLATLRKAAESFEQAGDIRSRAVTLGKIADILARQGETDEALRIHREEELPVYDKLGDILSRAVALGEIADILERQGEIDEVLRIRREEELPVYDKLGDIRSRAVTLGKIADILVQRGETDEALRIRREECLPVFDTLGDIRERAVAQGKIADILAQQGKTDEALRIRREEQLPVYDQLGDILSRAVAQGKIAEILAQRGEADEALRIYREDCLPVLRQLQDIHSISAILFACATLRLQQESQTAGQRQIIAAELGESFAITLRLRHPPGIAMVGAAYGQVLAAGRHFAEARQVLTLAAEAFQVLGQPDRAAQVHEIIARIHSQENDPS